MPKSTKPPKTKPEIFRPSETCVNLKMMIAKSTSDITPNKKVNFVDFISFYSAGPLAFIRSGKNNFAINVEIKLAIEKRQS